MVNAQRVKMIAIIQPVAIVDNASWTTVEVDTKGWDYCTYVFVLGATDIAMTALAVTESDTTASGHVNVTGLIFGTSANTGGSTSTLPSATDDDKLFGFEIDLRGRKRFLDLTATGGDGTLGAFASCIAILSRGKEEPSTAAEAGYSQLLRV